ncbi:MAG: hypothetical protein K9N49_05425, partial [Candidatus Marinimicrobia bacterium]|nr:hypothetical protein [Candidatus Neomarinimicrobiota bacterium]
ALLTPPHGPAVMIDAGPAREAERILRQARARGVNRLAVLVLTKPDADFVGGAAAWIERGLVQEIWTTPDPGRSPVFTRLLAQARAHNLPVRVLAAGEQGRWPGGLTWEVHNPPAATAAQPAAGPLVLRVGAGSQAVWFMTAASSTLETELAARPFEAGATVLVLSQHGAAGAAQPDWLARVRPDWVVISVGAGNYEGAPAPAVLEALAKDGWPVWRTDLAGAFTLRWIP